MRAQAGIGRPRNPTLTRMPFPKERRVADPVVWSSHSSQQALHQDWPIHSSQQALHQGWPTNYTSNSSGEAPCPECLETKDHGMAILLFWTVLISLSHKGISISTACELSSPATMANHHSPLNDICWSTPFIGNFLNIDSVAYPEGKRQRNTASIP